MTRRLVALIGLFAVVASACSIRGSSAGSNLQPADFYAANPTLADVRSLLGDTNWWPGPPSFGVPPLDSAYVPFNEKFHVITRFVHLGTAETFDIENTLWNSTSAATTQLTNIQPRSAPRPLAQRWGTRLFITGRRRPEPRPSAQ